MKKYNHLLVILLLSVVTIFVLIRLGNINISLETLVRVNWRWYSLVFLFFYLSILSRGLRWQRILNTMGWPIGRVYATTLLTAGLFGSAIFPARAGDVGRVAMLKKDFQVPLAQGIASITTERALDVFAILTLASMGAMLALQGRLPIKVLELLGITTFLFVVGLIGLLTMPRLEIWLREPTFLRDHLPLPPIFWSLYEIVVDFGFALIHGVSALGKNPFALTAAIIESFLIWLYDALIIYCVLQTVGLHPPFGVSLFTAMISDLAIAIPFTPAGLGQFEVVLIGLLALFHISANDGSLAALLLRFAILWTFIPISGLITYLFGFSHIFTPSNSHPIEETEQTLPIN